MPSHSLNAKKFRPTRASMNSRKKQPRAPYKPAKDRRGHRTCIIRAKDHPTLDFNQYCLIKQVVAGSPREYPPTFEEWLQSDNVRHYWERLIIAELHLHELGGFSVDYYAPRDQAYFIPLLEAIGYRINSENLQWLNHAQVANGCDPVTGEPYIFRKTYFKEY